MLFSGYIVTIINPEGDSKEWIPGESRLLVAIREALENPSVLRVIISRGNKPQ